jgi:hypothetical protein
LLRAISAAQDQRLRALDQRRWPLANADKWKFLRYLRDGKMAVKRGAPSFLVER